jgi:hypothetical protein
MMFELLRSLLREQYDLISSVHMNSRGLKRTYSRVRFRREPDLAMAALSYGVGFALVSLSAGP